MNKNDAQSALHAYAARDATRLAETQIASAIERQKENPSEVRVVINVERGNQLLFSTKEYSVAERAAVKALLLRFELQRLHARHADAIRRLNQLGFDPEA